MAGGPSGHASPDRVTDYPKYLLTNIPPDHRGWLSRRAEALDQSVADTIRALLCAHYRLDCPPVSFVYDPGRDRQAPNMVLRMQPKLARALERDVARSGRSKRRIILRIIDTAYRKEHQ